MRNIPLYKRTAWLLMLWAISATSCTKLITADEPVDTVTTTKMFDTEEKLEGAIVGAYNSLIHGTVENVEQAAFQAFAGGLASFAGGLSSDEFYYYNGNTVPADYVLSVNKLTPSNSDRVAAIWNSAYNAIFTCNTTMEGIYASKSDKIRDSVKNEIIAEAKFIRAFCYFHLVNFFGDVPLVLTGDFNQTSRIPRTAVQEVYNQILKDLKEAEPALPTDYSVGRGKRVRANRYAALALQAKVHLYLKEYEQAAQKASEVISNTVLFNLEPNADNTFLTTSREAILQLSQTDKDSRLRNATTFGFQSHLYVLSEELMNSFEQGDLRRQYWVRFTDNFFCNKYKIGNENGVFGAAPREYLMVFRLAEMFLIRGEARANGAPGGLSGAIEDLNALRRRADLDELEEDLDADAVKDAVAQERRIELFGEWANRWFDLKRTGKASSVLQTVARKLPWEGDYQLLYPIPPSEIIRNRAIIQNFGYASE